MYPANCCLFVNWNIFRKFVGRGEPMGQLVDWELLLSGFQFEWLATDVRDTGTSAWELMEGNLGNHGSQPLNARG